jgi:hypothetical protein
MKIDDLNRKLEVWDGQQIEVEGTIVAQQGNSKTWYITNLSVYDETMPNLSIRLIDENYSVKRNIADLFDSVLPHKDPIETFFAMMNQEAFSNISEEKEARLHYNKLKQTGQIEDLNYFEKHNLIKRLSQYLEELQYSSSTLLSRIPDQSTHMTLKKQLQSKLTCAYYGKVRGVLHNADSSNIFIDNISSIILIGSSVSRTISLQSPQLSELDLGSNKLLDVNDILIANDDLYDVRIGGVWIDSAEGSFIVPTLVHSMLAFPERYGILIESNQTLLSIRNAYLNSTQSPWRVDPIHIVADIVSSNHEAFKKSIVNVKAVGLKTILGNYCWTFNK